MDVNLKLLPEAVFDTQSCEKSAILSQIAARLGDCYGLNPALVLERLEEREKLGSTGFGRGVAIPHCRSGEVKLPVVALARLGQAADFGAVDAVPVSLVFGLVSPENAGATHLHALAAISRLMRDETMIDALLGAPDNEAMFALLTNQFLRDAA